MDTQRMRDKARAHVALAKEGFRPLSNFYAALCLVEQAAQIEGNQ